MRKPDRDRYSNAATILSKCLFYRCLIVNVNELTKS